MRRSETEDMKFSRSDTLSPDNIDRTSKEIIVNVVSANCGVKLRKGNLLPAGVVVRCETSRRIVTNVLIVGED